MKNDTAAEVRTCQCKFQLITVPLRTTMHIIACKLIPDHCWTEMKMETSNAN